MAYTLIVSGERFNLTKRQLESDPDNYFTTYFFGPFSEATDEMNELVLEKEPALFRLIQAHLRGYEILPIPDGYIPYMSKEVVLKNLMQEAELYGWGGLVKKIKDFHDMNYLSPTLPLTTAQSKYKFRSRSWRDSRVYSWNISEAEYHSLLSGSGSRVWGEWDPKLAVAGYRVLTSWMDYIQMGDRWNSTCCAILVLDN